MDAFPVSENMRIAFPYDYARVEAEVMGHVPAWRGMGFAAVVAIARGGLMPGGMAASALSLPLYALSYGRAARKVGWFTAERPEPGARLLLVEDVAGRGTTLLDCRDYLLAQGHELRIFALAHDEQSRIVPDFGLRVPTGYGAHFPWERESVTQSFAATGNMPARPEYEYSSWAVDLDGILVPDLPARLYEQDLDLALSLRDLLDPCPVLPLMDLAHATVITGRPEQDRPRTRAWLDRHGFGGPLLMRDPARHAEADTARFKAQSILGHCHTHFIESDAAQAAQIARLAPVTRVFWWDGRRALALQARLADPLARA